MPDEKQIKILVSQDEHHLVRIAAALENTTMAEFCRDVALERAREVTKAPKIPAVGQSPKKGKR